MIVDVEVTQEDIANGPCKCFIANALCRYVKPEVAVFVGCEYISMWLGSEYKELPTTKPVDSFVFSFDHGGHVKPFVFPLGIPDHFLRETPEDDLT